MGMPLFRKSALLRWHLSPLTHRFKFTLLTQRKAATHLQHLAHVAGSVGKTQQVRVLKPVSKAALNDECGLPMIIREQQNFVTVISCSASP